MLYLILGAIGLLIGAVSYRDAAPVYGVAIGLMIAEVFKLRKRLSKLEKGAAVKPVQKSEAVANQVWKVSDPPQQAAPQPKPVQPPVQESIASEDDLTDLEVDLINTRAAKRPIIAQPDPPSGANTQKSSEAFAALPAQLGKQLKDFFTTGNVVTKIGVIVLFFGFAFLLKYASQRNLIPIEFRLIGVFLGGLGLLGAGWYLRERKLMYGLLLQGCGIGVLYLTLFAAARFYHLLPYGFSFVVMVCVVVLSGILAVLQDAKYLALFGIVGGFLAPVLMSTGSGSHVVLFSYYALLNIGIAGIAWYKAWRALNLVGFVFTFAIASLWGNRYYQPQFFSTTEPFLIIFFLCYVAIAVLFALRQPVNLKGYVDGTLVFGVPLVAFGLQYGLVRDFPYGMAISALSLGFFYILLATLLWRRKGDDLRLLAESFLSFGVVFGSLAIPLALDGRWTSAAWALEGGAIFWIGARQGRLLPRLFGVLLQAGSGISFLIAMDNPFRQIPVANSFFLGCVFISLAGLFTSWYLTKRTEVKRPWEHQAAIPLMIWGLLWWFGASLNEIERFVSWDDVNAVVLTHAALTFLITDTVSRRLAWKEFSYPSILLLPVMVVALLYHLSGGSGNAHPFGGMGWMAWAIAFCVQYRLLYACEKIGPEKIISIWHQGTFWLLLSVLIFESDYFMEHILSVGQTWRYCVWGLVPGAAVLLLLIKGEKLAWPIRRFKDTYLGLGAALPVLLIFGWALLANFYHGDPAPLPYLPILNPLVLSQIFLLLIALKWLDDRKAWLQKVSSDVNAPVLKMFVAGVGFLLLNAIVARTIHFWARVPYTASGMFDSVLFQAAISIVWGVTALAVALVATRIGSRPAWIAGASILSLVVVKLFFVDLAGIGSIARIVSFLGVGSLMLLIGYFSPLPPAHDREAS